MIGCLAFWRTMPLSPCLNAFVHPGDPWVINAVVIIVVVAVAVAEILAVAMAVAAAAAAEAAAWSVLWRLRLSHGFLYNTHWKQQPILWRTRPWHLDAFWAPTMSSSFALACMLRVDVINIFLRKCSEIWAVYRAAQIWPAAHLCGTCLCIFQIG